ncbi:hypothetical protein Dsin_016095 [Dipteronia sinensis]|uniref:Ubiquitin-like protease family profile domain-containing protein n=1 Tax=Dipteronia sinensis TaxID=43782 RepID=A0AAE0ACJ5_9ROSI|nr:hypothetical protein Dsin_016095 [Dipteronia sinensis]
MLPLKMGSMLGILRIMRIYDLQTYGQGLWLGDFDQPKDGLKMALVLIANNVLFGQDLMRKATLWLFQMVEDLEAFSSFPWGSYVYMMTIHYLRQGFRSANAPLKHITHYNLYGFPWALEIWAMEVFGSLIDLVGKNLGHRHPRLKNWRIFKRPHDFFGKFAKYEKEVGDDSTDSSRIMREVMSAMSDQFEDIVKEIKKEISAMEDRLNARLTRVEASLAQLVNQHRQVTNYDISTPEVQEDYVGGHNVGGEGTVGKGVGEGDANRTEAFDGGNGTVGKRVGEGDATLTEALDGGDGTVGKGVSRGDNDQGGPDSTLGGGDGTFTEGIVGGDDTLSEGLQIVVHNILLQEGIVVQSHPPSEDDSTMVDYLAVKNEREQRLKITSRYMNSPYIDPFQAPDKEKQKLKTDYSHFKRSRKDAALNVGTDYYATKQFFVEMESPTCWLSNELLVPCAVGDPDGHWILCVIDLEKRTVCIYDPLHRQKKIPTRRKQITPLLRFFPVILQESGYYQQKGIQPNGSMFAVQQSIPKKLPAQMDNDSCGVFICRYTDMLMRHKSFWGMGNQECPRV